MNYSDGKCQITNLLPTKHSQHNEMKNYEIILDKSKIELFLPITSEYDGYDDVYGHSVDEEQSCISPTDAQQWIYDRNRGQQSVSSFIANNRDIEEEDEGAEAMADELHKKLRRDSEVSDWIRIQLIRLKTNILFTFSCRISLCQI